MQDPKNRHLGTIAQLCWAISSQLRHVSSIGKILSSNISSTSPHNMVNFGLLVAEIVSLVWGIPANFDGFRILASLLQQRRSMKANQTLHNVWPLPGLAVEQWPRGKLCGTEHRAPPIFCRATIRLGIGPHSVVNNWVQSEPILINFDIQNSKNVKLECGLMLNMMAAQPNIGGALCDSSVILFLVPCHKVWLMAAARVPYSNAANIGERKTWTQSEFYSWQNSINGQETPKCIHI